MKQSRYPAHTYIRSNLGRHNAAFVVSQVKVQMREKISLSGSLNFTHDEILFSSISNVSPHGKVLDKHLKKKTVLNRFLERLQSCRIQRGLAQQTPVNRITEGDLIGGGLATVTDNAFTQALTMTNRSFALVPAIDEDLYIFLFGSFVFFRYRRVSLAKRERIITVRFGRVVERTAL
jgi:hypothetical protein